MSADDILVLKNCGPKGYPGMAEVGNMPLPVKLLRQGVTDMVRISDARMSGTAYGTVVLHAAPEAAAGGNLALVKTGDIIELDVERRRLHLEVSDEELKRRRAAWKAPASPMSRGYTKLYFDHVQQADKGADLDFLVGASGSAVAEGQPLRLHDVRALITDYDFPDIELEREVFRTGGVEHVVAQCRTEDDLIAAARECDALLLQYAPVTDRVLAALPRIGLVSRYGAGFDTIDTEACRRHGVWVANSPDYGVGEVATHALAMTLALIRHLMIYDRDVKAGRWHYLSAGKIRRASLMTVGVLGLGRIGKRYAALARECFAKVIACDPYLNDADFPPYVQRVGLTELFEHADAISLHVPLNDETRGMVDASLLAKLKPDSVLINTARGGVVDIDALRAALDEGRLDGAALDVLPTEPIAPQHPLARHPRVLLTPHAAFYSCESEVELRRKAALNIVQWAATGRPMYPVVQGSKSPR